MTEPEPKMARVLTCARHGLRRWQGHIMCDACGRVFQTDDAKRPFAAPDVCSCGAQLKPPPEVAVDGDMLGLNVAGIGTVLDNKGGAAEIFETYDTKDWTARPICYLCFRSITKRHGGRTPGWGGEEWKRWRAAQEGN